MRDLWIILLASWLAGAAAFAGGSAAWFEGKADSQAKREILHGVIAFGGGLLVSAVAFALIPDGIASLGAVSLLVSFCLGGLLFCGLDVFLSARGGAKSQFLAMLLDFLPEALSLGAVFSRDRKLGILLAAFIGAQNLPEGFNAFREMTASGARRSVVLIVLLFASLFGPLAAGVGYFFLQGKDALTAWIMTFASGGILYLVFQDIAPQAKLRRHWTPALGAVLGFAVGLLGKKLIG